MTENLAIFVIRVFAKLCYRYFLNSKSIFSLAHSRIHFLVKMNNKTCVVIRIFLLLLAMSLRSAISTAGASASDFCLLQGRSRVCPNGFQEEVIRLSVLQSFQPSVRVNAIILSINQLQKINYFHNCSKRLLICMRR